MFVTFFHSLVCTTSTMFISSVACTGFICFSKWFLFYFLIRKSCFALTLIFFLCTAFFFFFLNLLAGYDGRWTGQQMAIVNKLQKKNPTHPWGRVFLCCDESVFKYSLGSAALVPLESSFKQGCIALCSMHASMLYATQNSVETELNLKTRTDGPSGRLYTVKLPVLIEHLKS